MDQYGAGYLGPLHPLTQYYCNILQLSGYDFPSHSGMSAKPDRFRSSNLPIGTIICNAMEVEQAEYFGPKDAINL